MIGVVVITRNEESNIRRTLTSLSSPLISEIIVSDSNSTDKTASIVSTLVKGDTRIRFTSYSCAPFTAARGRNEGAKVLSESSEYILFLDGDMELKPGFIEAALDKLAADSKLAAVSGQMDNYFYDDNLSLVNKQLEVYDLEKNQAGGAFLIRKSSFNAVGGFNSNLIVNEEAHLEYKLNLEGYLMQRCDIPMIIHHTELAISKARLKERLFDRKLTALGVNVYESFSDLKYFRILFRDNPFTLVSAFYFLMVPFLFFIDVYFPLIGVAALYFSFVLKLGSLRVPINYLIYGVGVIWGCGSCILKEKIKLSG